MLLQLLLLLLRRRRLHFLHIFFILVLLTSTTFVVKSFPLYHELSSHRTICLTQQQQHHPRVGWIFSGDSSASSSTRQHQDGGFRLTSKLQRRHGLKIQRKCMKNTILYSSITTQNPNLNNNNINDTIKFTFLERVQQLVEYQQEHGHTLVPKRYKQNPQLANWVNKQRQQYRNYQLGKRPCSLTKQRIQLLNDIGFCWNATNMVPNQYHSNSFLQSSITTNSTTINNPNQPVVTKGGLETSKQSQQSQKNPITMSPHRQVIWYKKLDQVRTLLQQQNSSSIQQVIPSQSSLGHWIRRQRKEYLKEGGPTTLTTDMIDELNDIDKYWWKTKRQYQWECRVQELKKYQQEFGDCCVPISHTNKQLAHWVSNQRKKYNLKMAGKASDLTNDQINELNTIGFVWNRWEYEFERSEYLFIDKASSTRCKIFDKKI